MYFLNVTIHVAAAMLWLGGMFFLAVVGGPVLRDVEPAALRAALFQRLGERFRTVGWLCIIVLLATGVGNLYFHGVLHSDVLLSAAFWHTPFGRTLAWKLVAVLAMLIVSAVHDFVLGPAASRAVPGTPQAIRARRQAAWLARINALLGIIVVIAAVRLARGG